MHIWVLTGELTGTCKGPESRVAGPETNSGREHHQSVRQRNKPAEAQHKTGIVQKRGYRIKVMVGKMWVCYVAGDGKLFGKFLGSWASSRCVLSSEPPHPHQLQGHPGQDPAERAAWGGTREMKISASCECQEEEPRSKMAQGHSVWGGASPEEESKSCSHDFASSSLGTKSSHAGWASCFFFTTQSWLLANPMTHSLSQLCFCNS